MTPMRTTLTFLFGGAAVALASIAGCGDDESSGTSSTGGPGGTCAPGAGCPDVASECVALVDNSGKDKFALRIGQLTVVTPMALNTGIVETVVSDGVTMNLAECKSESGFTLLDGMGSFSWILEFDRATDMLKTGGADVTPSPGDGYCFLNGTIQGFDVAPFEVGAAIDASGNVAPTEARDVTVPIFTDASATSVVLLPLKSVELTGMKVSSDQNCIGSLNPELDPNNLCLPATNIGVPRFVDGGTLAGYIVLEDADQIEVEQAGNSLCVLLSGNLATYGEIEFKGDWCAADNGPATATCYDAVRLESNFSASAVEITGDCN
jgi:hypothetical protein